MGGGKKFVEKKSLGKERFETNTKGVRHLLKKKVPGGGEKPGEKKITKVSNPKKIKPPGVGGPVE